MSPFLLQTNQVSVTIKETFKDAVPVCFASEVATSVHDAGLLSSVPISFQCNEEGKKTSQKAELAEPAHSNSCGVCSFVRIKNSVLAMFYS